MSNRSNTPMKVKRINLTTHEVEVYPSMGAVARLANTTTAQVGYVINKNHTMLNSKWYFTNDPVTITEDEIIKHDGNKVSLEERKDNKAIMQLRLIKTLKHKLKPSDRVYCQDMWWTVCKIYPHFFTCSRLFESNTFMYSEIKGYKKGGIQV